MLVQTKYVKATNARGSRIRVTCVESGKSRLMPYDYGARCAHVSAATSYAVAACIDGPESVETLSSTPAGYVFRLNWPNT